MKQKFSKTTFLLVMLTSLFAIKAQEVQWASSIVEFSSELSAVEYSAEQVLGKPNVFPDATENPNAWAPSKNNKKEFIKVAFKDALQIQQIIIAEGMNASVVTKVTAFDEIGTPYELFNFSPRSVGTKRRLLNVTFDRTDYKVKYVRVDFDCSEVDGFNTIDAIGIIDSKVPFQIKIAKITGIDEAVKAQRLGKQVNSDYIEFKPLISPDGKTLYFSRQNHPENIGGVADKEDIWYSTRESADQPWSKAKNIGAPFNNAGPNFISSITPDGGSMIVILGNRYGKKGKMLAGVSMCIQTSEGWSDPINLEIKNDYNVSQKVDYYLANNRKTLIMSVERNDTNGARDLYVSFVGSDGTWSEPMNLGKDLNTASDEGAPFLAPDDKTLYFSTSGYAGFGGSDIYVTRRLDDTWQHWSEPENMGPGINSRVDDMFFNISADGSEGYFSRSSSDTDSDIFSMDLPAMYRPSMIFQLTGKVVDSETGEPLAARISYESLATGKEIGTVTSDPKTGDYEIMLPIGDNYGYLAKKEGFIGVSNNLNLEGEASFKKLSRDISMVKIKKDAVVRLNNIFFEFNQSKLKPDSYPELDRLVDFLKKNKSIRIEVAGHTDNIGKRDYNLRLSRKRAERVQKYLIVNGVSKSRLDAAGFGPDKPIASNKEEKEGRELNRRVEFKIIKE